VLASALLGESPPTLPVRRLVRVAALFGINENRARVALSRMVAHEEVVADGSGGYTLSGHLADRAARLAVARTAATAAFDGTWHVIVVTPAGATPNERRARRTVLRSAKLAELRDGTWVRPANLDVRLDATTDDAATRFTATPDGDAAALASRVFDVAGWARRAERLCDVLDECTLDAPGSLAIGFERDAEVLRHLQRDPLLPAALLPKGWPGPALRARFDAFDVSYRRALREAHHAVAAAGGAPTP
jgi:phenylacetic acid degradation operon negative regulatory protein